MGTVGPVKNACVPWPLRDRKGEAGDPPPAGKRAQKVSRLRYLERAWFVLEAGTTAGFALGAGARGVRARGREGVTFAANGHLEGGAVGPARRQREGRPCQRAPDDPKARTGARPARRAVAGRSGGGRNPPAGGGG